MFRKTILTATAAVALALPAYAGNLDIMTSAGLGTAERIATMKLGVSA